MVWCLRGRIWTKLGPDVVKNKEAGISMFFFYILHEVGTHIYKQEVVVRPIGGNIASKFKYLVSDQRSSF